MKNLFITSCTALALLLSACGGGPFDINREGGYVYTLEADAADFLLQASGYSQNPAFNAALQKTLASNTPRTAEFIRVFGEHYKNMQGSTSLSIIFGSADRQRYDPGASQAQTIETLQKEYGNAKDRVVSILTNRLNKLGVDGSKMNIYTDKGGHIVVEAGNAYDQQRLQHMLTATGQLGFYETYENEETYRYIDDFEKAYVALNPDTNSFLAAGDSVNEAEIKKHPLGQLLILSMRRNETRYDENGNSTRFAFAFEPGCRIGFADARDTAHINDMLYSALAQRIFPRNMHFIWGHKPEEHPVDNRKTALPLYVVKASHRMHPALDGRVITAAYADKDKYSGNMIVNISMNPEGAEKWGHITGENKGHAIAMVFDGYVVSAPRVEGPITGGNSVISGNFTVDEAKEMALIIESASLPASIRIINKQQVKKKP